MATYPKMLPAGTVIRIKQRKDLREREQIRDDALDLEFIVSKDLEQERNGRYGVSIKSKIVKNPNYWTSEHVNHEIDLHYDEIVSGLPNKDQKYLLEKVDD